MGLSKHHELFVGEKVYDNNMDLICEILEINGDNVRVSQGKYTPTNKLWFDVDCEQDPDEWETQASQLYQFVDGIVDEREGMPVCYEHMSIDYPYYSPYLHENLYEFETKRENS